MGAADMDMPAWDREGALPRGLGKAHAPQIAQSCKDTSVNQKEYPQIPVRSESCPCPKGQDDLK